MADLACDDAIMLYVCLFVYIELDAMVDLGAMAIAPGPHTR